MALKGDNPVVGGTVLRRAAIQSPDFVKMPLTGWAINQDGSAFFANVTVQGTITGATITGSTFSGTDFIINAAGAFFYSAAPAAGNLTASITNAAGTDSFGNNYLAGHATYGASFATSLNSGFVSFYTGSLAGGWTQQAFVETDAGGDLLLTANGQIVLTATTTLALSGTSVTINGSSSTATSGLPDGTIHGTSGGASAGTAHTHGPGSFAVGNGVHNHVL